MEHDQLFVEFNVGAARHVTLGTEVRMRAEYNVREKRKLKFVVEEKDILLEAKDKEIESLRAQLLVREAEAAEAIRLRAEAAKFESAKQSLRDEVQALKDRNTGLEKKKSELAVKVSDLAASVNVKEQEVADLDAQVTTVKSQSDNLVGDELETSSAGLQEKVATYEDFIDQLEKWLLTYGMELAIAKCLKSPEYPSALMARKSVNFSLLAELKLNKDSSVETIMNILRLEDSVAARLGLSESQPHVDQLMIKENIANYRSALHDVFVPLAEPFSTMALQGAKGTSSAAPNTTTALSVTFVSASTIPPISTDDYEVIHADGQEGVGAGHDNVDPILDVGDAELNVLE
ncbi:hypothetical protein Tco_0881944 [Tanacetum coccineum]